MLARIKELIRQDKLVKFYQSRPWRSVRYQVLVRDNFECQECKRNGRVTSTPHHTHGTRHRTHGKKRESSLHVHHIKELKDYPELALVMSNLETLCVRCHNEVHDRLKDFNQKQVPFYSEERW